MISAKAPLGVSPLPGMGSVTALAQWVERHEELLSSYLLTHDEADAHGNTMCAVFLSRDDNGEYLLRLCEGFSDAMMIWREQRRAQPMFGRSYAEAIIHQWLRQREGTGYRVEWSARREDRATPALSAA